MVRELVVRIDMLGTEHVLSASDVRRHDLRRELLWAGGVRGRRVLRRGDLQSAGGNIGEGTPFARQVAE